MNIFQPDEESLTRAVRALMAGQLVAFPTETVYGLGANARDLEAIKRLYAAKGRPANHPVIVHLASVEQLDDWAVRIPQAALRLGRSLWPGPLTMILPKADHVYAEITGGQNSVALRVPAHPVAQGLLRGFGDGLIAPSANKFGRLSPTTAQDVASDFGSELEMILDGGPCSVGVESTIVDFTVEPPRLLRPGMILADQIEAIIGKLQRTMPLLPQQAEHTRAPGDLASHYAPSTPLCTLSPAELLAKVATLASNGMKFCVLSFRESSVDHIPWIVAPRQPELYAHQLYRSLRKLDSEQTALILVEEVPTTDDWSAVADRLRRASTKPSES